MAHNFDIYIHERIIMKYEILEEILVYNSAIKVNEVMALKSLKVIEMAGLAPVPMAGMILAGV